MTDMWAMFEFGMCDREGYACLNVKKNLKKKKVAHMFFEASK